MLGKILNSGSSNNFGVRKCRFKSLHFWYLAI